MEYGLRIATLEGAFKSPCDFGDPSFWKPYHDASLTALYYGSEFCQDLLPGSPETEAFCSHCAERDLEAVLLTPIVTQRGLNRIARLLESLTGQGWRPAIVFNDWGVLELLRNVHPTLPRHMGRLMNRGLRDPRLEMQAMEPAGENTQRGTGIRKLASSLGVSALETDADLEPGFLGEGNDGLMRTLHAPFTFVSSGRNCLEKATVATEEKKAFTHGLGTGCSAPCRDICRKEFREDTQKQMWRAGNTVFFEAPPQWLSRHIKLADRVVFHEQPMP